MSADDKQFLEAFMESDPAKWPAGLKRPSDESASVSAPLSAPLSAARPAPGDDSRGDAMDRAVLSALAEKRAKISSAPGAPARTGFRPVFAWSAAAMVLLSLGLTYFIYSSGTISPPFAKVIAAYRTAPGFPGPGEAPGEKALNLPPGALVYIALGKGTSIQITGPGRYQISGSRDDVRVRIDAGRLAFVSANETARVVLKTPGAVYRRRGTRARLVVDATGDRLEIAEGSFRVRNPAGEIRAKAGKVVRVPRPKKEGPPSAPVERELSPAESRSLKTMLAVVDKVAKRRADANQSPDKGAPTKEGGMSLPEIAAVYGKVFRVSLNDGRVLQGHLFEKGGRTFMVTPKGTIAIDSRAISDLEAIQ